MATIKLKGDTSGEIIIQAPAVAGTNTLTLDATTGTILNSNSSIPASSLTGSLPALDASSLTNIPAANLTGSLPAIDGSSLTGISGGKILQVVSNTYTGIVQYNVNSWSIISQLNTAITPSSTSSKILVLISISTSGYDHPFRLYKNGSALSGALGTAAGNRVTTTFNNLQGASAANEINNNNIMYLDSPSSTSAQTYSVGVYSSNNGTFFVNRSANDTNNSTAQRAISTVTLMEVGA